MFDEGQVKEIGGGRLQGVKRLNKTQQNQYKKQSKSTMAQYSMAKEVKLECTPSRASINALFWCIKLVKWACAVA